MILDESFNAVLASPTRNYSLCEDQILFTQRMLNSFATSHEYTKMFKMQLCVLSCRVLSSELRVLSCSEVSVVPSSEL